MKPIVPSTNSSVRADPFEVDPILLGPVRRASATGLAVLMLVPLAVVLLAAAAAIGNKFGHSGVPSNAGLSDLASLVVNVKNDPHPDFPFSRDIVMIVVVALAMATPAMVFQQWRGFKRVLVVVLDPKLFFFVDESVANQFRSALQRTAGVLKRDGSRLRVAARIAIAFLLGLGILLAQRSAGIYGIFRPADSTLSKQAWRTAAYTGWWLNVRHDPLATIIFLGVATGFCYIIIVQNTVNFRIFQLFHPYRNSFAFGFDIDRKFDFYGWQPLRDALNVGELSMFVYGVLILLYLAVVTPQALVEWMAPLTVLYLIALPTFTIGPLRMFRRGRLRAKRMEVSRLQKIRDSAVSQDQRVQIEARIQTIREVPDNLYNLRQSLLTLLPLGLLFLTFVFQVLTLLRSR